MANWLRYGPVTFIAAVLVLAGCASLPPAEREALVQTSYMYSRGENSAAIRQLDRLIQDYGKTFEISEAYYLRGLCRTRKGQITVATEDFELAIEKSKRDDLTAKCRASLAALAYKQGDWAKAADLYEEAVPDLPNQPPTDQILYCAGIAMQRIGKWKEAALAFGRVLRRFRDRPIAADARRMAGWGHEYHSVQLGAFRYVDNAEKTVRSFRAKGLDAVQENHPRNGQALWVVMAGRYRTYAEAVAALGRARRIQADAVIIP